MGLDRLNASVGKAVLSERILRIGGVYADAAGLSHPAGRDVSCPA